MRRVKNAPNENHKTQLNIHPTHKDISKVLLQAQQY